MTEIITRGAAAAAGADQPGADGAVEAALRVELAAVFRLAARNGWHEAVANHFSAAVSADGRRFLVNPRWRHFETIRASELLLVDADDPDVMSRPDAPDPSAWSIHRALHATVPQARVALHVHPPYATALACLQDPTLVPVDQNCARYFRRVVVDRAYGGLADDPAEGERIAGLLGDGRTMLLGNHGVLVVAPTVAEAYDDLYYLERACRVLVLAYSTGRELRVLPDDVAERTALGWAADTWAAFAHAHLAESMALLDRTDPDFRL